MIAMFKRGSRRRLSAQDCRWYGEHSEDPTPVTVLTLEHECGHGDDDAPVPTCTRHLTMVESTAGIARHPTTCSTCGTVSALRVVSRVIAR